jgi:hypothetical protein
VEKTITSRWRRSQDRWQRFQQIFVVVADWQENRYINVIVTHQEVRNPQMPSQDIHPRILESMPFNHREKLLIESRKG